MDVILNKKNESYIEVIAETSILYELRDCFSFFADGYKFHPKYRQKLWDGKIILLRLVSKNKGEIYYGLMNEIISFCRTRNYSYKLSDALKHQKINEEKILRYINSLNIGYKNEQINLRDYQIKGIIDSIQNKRNLILSVTSSGKSAIIYGIIRFLTDNKLKGLVIVPNVSLIHQLHNDFVEYSCLNNWDHEQNIHKIFSGQDKNSEKLCHLSTWQSLMTIKQNSFFEQYDYAIIDECHGLKAVELTKILEKCVNASYRIGLTGTVDNIKANINTLIGLTGPINKLNSTKELMDRKEIASFNIKCLILDYDKETCKAVKKFKYQEEIKFIVSNTKRNAFIKNLALSLDKNSIILCNFVETHGKIIYELLLNSKHRKNRNIYFIHGGVEGEERERIRNIMETETNAIIVASSSIMSAGVSIRNLHNIIFAISGKSRIRTLQSIGRVLRLHKDKEIATLYDIVDNLSVGKHQNFTLNHFLERIKMYNQEKFDYKTINIEFKQ